MWGIASGLAVGAVVWHEYEPVSAYLVRTMSLNRRAALEATSNAIKATVLLLLCAYSITSGEAVRTVWGDRFAERPARVTMAIYAALDVVSLAKVPTLKRSTIVHHTGVGLATAWMLLGVGWGDDGAHAPRLAKCLFVYGLLSSYAYAVNALLAVRRVISPHTRLRWPALVIYGVACLCNWSYQLYWMHDIHWSLWMPFLTVLYMFVQDDLILLKWLYQGPRVPQTTHPCTPNHQHNSSRRPCDARLSAAIPAETACSLTV